MSNTKKSTSNTPKPAPPARGLVFNAASHRYRLDGKPVSGATSIISGGLPKPALVGWAARSVAEWVIDPLNKKQLLSLLNIDPVEARAFLSSIPNRKRDSAAATGTEVHSLSEQLALTDEVDAPEELFGYIEGYSQWLADWEVTPLLAERACASRAQWHAGMFDLICSSPYLCDGKPVLVDIKTSKSVYMDTALQLACYARSEFYVDVDGTEVPMPDVAATYVLHVTPMDREGEHDRYGNHPLGSTLYMIAPTPGEITEHYEQFLAVKRVKEDAQRRGKMSPELVSFPVDNAATSG